MPPPEQLALLVVGGAAAGFVNTLAGGGSFLTVPLLIEMGLPATVANATNRVGVLVSNLSAVAGFRQEGVSGVGVAARLLPATLVGSFLGAWVASNAPDAMFERAFGVVMLAALPVILRNPKPSAERPRRTLPLWLQWVLYFAVGFYGGAFQAGLGIPLLFALVAGGGLDLVRANAAKVVVIAALTAVALAQFVWADKVAWAQGLVLAVGFAAGAYTASRYGARVGERLIRPVLALAVIALAVRLLL